MNIIRAVVATVGAVAVALAGAVAVAPERAEALTGGDFDPGMIISDSIFFDEDTMTASSIQGFLNGKVSSCRAGYTCLKDYRETTWTRPADPMCSTYTGAANETAATIIFKVAQACGINPQVLLVTLQKEQGLVTHTYPSSGRFQRAMGYGCPDTAPCNTEFYGFYNQVYKAAWAFQRYGMPPGTGPGTPYTTNYSWFPVGHPIGILYHPNSGCGRKTVTIQNKATAALYYYTPYTPNGAALANLGGTGDSCSSYGNRNFWYYFTNWFGSTIEPVGLQLYVGQVYIDVLGREADPGGLAGWVDAIQRGMPRQMVAGGFVGSREYRLLKIDAAYWEVLGREPDPGGRASWLTATYRGVTSADSIYQLFLTTHEFYVNSGGTDEKWVNALYELVIGRSASPSEQAYWAGMRQQYGRSAVVNIIYNAWETRRERVDLAYLTYLRRPATETEKSSGASFALQRGWAALRASLLGGAEYWVLTQSGPHPPYAPETEGDGGTTSEPTPTPTPTPEPTGTPGPTATVTPTPTPTAPAGRRVRRPVSARRRPQTNRTRARRRP